MKCYSDRITDRVFIMVSGVIMPYRHEKNQTKCRSTFIKLIYVTETYQKLVDAKDI